jgi:hypothetical protein
MHPEVLQDGPGDCPKCGMALVPMGGVGAADDTELQDLQRALWIGTALSAPQIKKNMIEACVHVVGADGLIQEREAELLRAIVDTMDCPIPPFVVIAES